MMVHALKLIVSAALLGTILWLADPRQVLAHLRGADIGWLAVALVTLTCITLLMARRWQLAAQKLSIAIGYRHAVAEYYIAQLVNLMLPGGVVGDIGRAMRLRHQGDMTRAAQSVAAERVVGQIVLFAIMGCALGLALILPGGVAWPAWVWAALAALVGCLLLAVVLSQRTTPTGRFLHLVIVLLCQRQVLILSIAVAGLLPLSLYACARATGTILPPETWLTLLPLVLSAMLVPLSIAGWGWREGAAAVLFPMAGATPAAGIAMGITYGAIMTIAALPALFLMIKYAMQSKDLATERTLS